MKIEEGEDDESDAAFCAVAVEVATVAVPGSIPYGHG